MKRLVSTRYLCAIGTVIIAALAAPRAEAACAPTGFGALTAALVNPAGPVSGPVNATGCDIGVYYNQGTGTVANATIFGALSYGVFVNGDVNSVAVDVIDSLINDIGDTPFNGNQRGVGIYYRAFFGGSVTGRISGNTIWDYQKGGIVTNGARVKVQITGNSVTGFGPVGFIAQNGIQIGYGASATVMRNTVEGHSYTGTSTVAGGIIVVGGPLYGVCPNGQPCPYTTGTTIVQNTVRNNDIGIFLTNLNNWNPLTQTYAPPVQTNIKATNNVISSAALQNNYGGSSYQAGIADTGNNDKLIGNEISGAGYDPSAYPFAYVVGIDADPSFTDRAKVHANH
jgi:hypothetical protein